MTTAAKDWKKPEELELPSGNTCLVRRKPMGALLRSGRVPNALMPMLKEAFKRGGKPEDIPPEIEGLDDMVDLYNKVDMVVVECVVNPKVLPVPPEGEDRDEDALYVDDIDDDDKMAVFNFAVSGVKDMESFRRQRERDVVAVPDVGGVVGAPEPASGTP